MNFSEKFKKSENLIFWGIFSIPFIMVILIFFIASIGGMGYMPSVGVLENPSINLASQVISEDDKVLGYFYFKNQNRTYIEYNDLPKYLIEALIATEDIRFYKHPGIDLKGFTRAVIKTGILGKSGAGGGSTLTQQLAKLLFHEPPDTKIERIRQKIKEWVIAVRLERAYTKQEIITMYFNQWDYLYQAVGIKSASEIYFNTRPKDLKIEEAAMLVGMAKNPSLFNPVRYPDTALWRRNVVFNQMYKYNFITKEERDSLKDLPLVTDFQKITHNLGLATYFREYIRLTLNANEPKKKDYYSYTRFKEDSVKWENDPLYGWCNKNKKPDGSTYNIYTDGLKIYTTVNSVMQLYAEEAVKEFLGGYLQEEFDKAVKYNRNPPFSDDLNLRQRNSIIRFAILNSNRGRTLRKQGLNYDQIYKEFKKPVEMIVFSWKGERDTIMSPLDSILYYKKFLHAGFMTMDPTTGYVKTYVGGIDMRHFQYDHVTMGKRQAGSTFKPFLYILAMQEGFSPCHKVASVPITFTLHDTTWTPRPTHAKHVGKMKTLKWGLALSENCISAWLVDQFKPQPIADIAYKMGVESYIDPVPSMILGTSEMTTAEMVSSYSTLANKGIYTKPLYVTRIEDKNGNVLATFQSPKKEAISDKTAYLMLNLMEGVVNFGTAVRLRNEYGLTAEIAGKTGTTQNNSDGWFIGITPKLAGGIWIGAEDRSVHFHRRSYMGTGSRMALPIYGLFMKKIYGDSTLMYSQNDVFEIPEGAKIDLNCDEAGDGTINIENFDDYPDIF